MSDVLSPAIEVLRVRIEEEDEPAAHHAEPRGGGLPWRYRMAAVASVVVVLAIVLVTGGGSRHESSILAKAYAATTNNGVILRYRETLSVRFDGHSHILRHGEVWISSGRLRIRTRNASGVSEEVHTAHSVTIYNATRNLIIHADVPVISMGSPYNFPSWMSNPISQLRSWYAHGRLRFKRRETRDGHPYDVLVSSGHPSGTQSGTRVLVQAHTFVPVEISNRIGGKRWIVRFSSFQRLPLTPAHRAELRLAQHPGATTQSASKRYGLSRARH